MNFGTYFKLLVEKNCMVKQEEIEKVLNHLDKSSVSAEKSAVMTERLTVILAAMTIMLFMFASHEVFRDFGNNQETSIVFAAITTILFTLVMVVAIKKIKF